MSPAIPGLRDGLRTVAGSICSACTGPDDEPCVDCRRDAPRLLLRFLAKLPPNHTMTPAILAAAVKAGGADG